MIFVATKMVRQKISSSSFGAVVGSGIRDKHPGSAALFYFFIDIFSGVQVLARA
jgi:hypothetical protein